MTTVAVGYKPMQVALVPDGFTARLHGIRVIGVASHY
jgi:hypothetical protein